jgi:flagellar biosynthesis protein FlhF
MNIKRFVARDMREALMQIRNSLGGDAVILSNQRVEGGVEVIAAVDYDDGMISAVSGSDAVQSAVPDALEQVSRPVQSAGSAYESAALSEYEQIARRTVAGDPAALAESGEASLEAQPEQSTAAMQAQPQANGGSSAAELKALKALLEDQLASLAWNNLNHRNPIRARVLKQFSRLGIDAQLARELTDAMPTTTNEREIWRLPLKLLSDRLPLATKELIEIGGIFAMIGPTGVGKTTSIAKIAARFALRYGVEGLGLVTTDCYRIGARDQLLTFARLLGVPMLVAEDAEDLSRRLNSLAGKQLILIDTAGMSHRDQRLARQFGTLRAGGKHTINTVLTLSASSDRAALGESFEVFKQANPKAMVITKLDEAASLGGVASLAIRERLPVAYLANGQRVPEDLHLAGPKRLWLVRNMARLAHLYAAEDDELALADTFGSMELVANA